MPNGIPIKPNTHFGYTVKASGKFGAIGNPYPVHGSLLLGTGSIEIYRYDASSGGYSHYGTSMAIKAAGSGTSNGISHSDGYGISHDLYQNVFVVGNSHFSGSYGAGVITGSCVDIYILNNSSSVSSVISDTLYSIGKIKSELGSSGNIVDSFAETVSVNDKYIVVGAKDALSYTGQVFVYSYNPSVNSIHPVLVGTITGTNANRKFGSTVRIDQNGSNSILVSEDSSLSNPKVYLYESESVGWSRTHTFSSITGSMNLPFDDVDAYGYAKNSQDGFGKSVQINGDTIVIGAPYDSTYYEYSTSTTKYAKGAVYIYRRTDCPSDYTITSSIYNDISASYWDLQTKYIGDVNTIKGNELGCSVDICDGMIIVGCIPSDYALLSDWSYFSSSISESYDDNGVICGEYVLFEHSGSNISPITFDLKKKEIGRPYVSYGNSVAISPTGVFIGSPFVSNAFNEINWVYGLEDEIADMKGYAYISTLSSLRTDYHAGNVFYKNGEVVFSNTGSQFTNMLKTDGTDIYKYDLSYKGNYTLNEKSIICTINPGEFNVSTNFTALNADDPVFDLNGDGECNFRDINLILLYITDINTPGAVDFSTDDTFWDDYVIETETERSLFNYYRKLYGYESDTLKVEYSQYYTKLVSLASNFDFDGDGKITINDAKILWKHFVNGLDLSSYQRLINPFSTRTTLTDVNSYLTSLTSKYATTNGIPVVKDEFSYYNQNTSVDITGSYLAPYITTIGLYQDTDLVAVAKLAFPVKNTGEYPLNFLIKWDV